MSGWAGAVIQIKQMMRSSVMLSWCTATGGAAVLDAMVIWLAVVAVKNKKDCVMATYNTSDLDSISEMKN